MSRTSDEDWALAFQPEDWMRRFYDQELAHQQRRLQVQKDDAQRRQECAELEAMWERS